MFSFRLIREITRRTLHMISAKSSQFTPDQRVINRIIVLRNENIMLDIHLAEIYEVETRALKQAVRRNLDLFPDDFMFVLTESELEEVVSQNVIPSKQHFGGSFPYAFTETGIAMLSSVLKSQRAREMNIAIIRTFVALRKILLNSSEIRLELESIKKKLGKYDQSIEIFYHHLDKLLRIQEKPKLPEKSIGYKIHPNE